MFCPGSAGLLRSAQRDANVRRHCGGERKRGETKRMRGEKENGRDEGLSPEVDFRSAVRRKQDTARVFQLKGGV